MNDEQDIDILDKETVYDGFFRMDRYRLRHRKFDGSWTPEISREIFERGNAVAALLYDPARDTVVMVEQFRLPAHLAGRSAWCLETRPASSSRARNWPMSRGARRWRKPAARSSARCARSGSSWPASAAARKSSRCSMGRSIRGRPTAFTESPMSMRTSGSMSSPPMRRSAKSIEGEIENAASVIALNWLARHHASLRRDGCLILT